MARVLVARQPWGTLWAKDPSSRALSVPLPGQLAALSGTVFSASTGSGTVAPAAFVTDANGDLPGWVDEGVYTLTVNSVAQQVEAVSGLTGSVGIGSSATQAGTLPAPTETTIWRFQPRDPAKAPFSWHVAGSTFNSTWDTVMYLGYNAAGAGGKIVNTEPSFRFVIEQDYEVTAGQHWLEAYVEWIAGSGATAAQNGRPLFWRFDRLTGSIVGFDIKSKGVQFTDWGDDTAFASIGGRDGSYTAFGHPAQAGNTQLSLTAQNAKDTAFSMSCSKGSFSIFPAAANQWALTIGGSAFMQVGQSTGNPIGLGNADSGQAAAVTIQLLTGVKTFWPALKLKKIASQTTPLLSVQDDTNVEQFAIDVDGVPKWTAVALQQTTVGAAGGATALPATPKKYLKVKDSTGTVYVVPCYNP